MLAALAAACRPHGAPRWDQAGIMAALGKVRHLSLADVALATFRAADDRESKTPGVIGNPQSPCWSERANERPANRDNPPKHERCGVCSLSRERCRQVWANDDHEFRPVRDERRDPEQIHQITEALRQAKAEDPPPPPEHETTTEGTERVGPMRAQLAAAREEADA